VVTCGADNRTVFAADRDFEAEWRALSGEAPAASDLPPEQAPDGQSS
jgi:hypothetical protein